MGFAYFAWTEPRYVGFPRRLPAGDFSLTASSSLLAWRQLASNPKRVIQPPDGIKLGWRTGFEPALREPQSLVLPLHYCHHKITILNELCLP